MKLSLKSDWSFAYFISYLAAITAVLLGIQLVVQVIMQSTTPIGMDMPVHYSVTETGQDRSVTLNGLVLLPDFKQEGTLIVKKIPDQPKIYLFLLAIFKHLQTGLYILGALLVWKIFGSIAEKKPFAKENYKRFFALGWTFITAEILAVSTSFYLNWLQGSGIINAGSYDFRVNIDSVSNFLIVGIIMIVLGYVFKEAYHLYQDQKLTV